MPSFACRFPLPSPRQHGASASAPPGGTGFPHGVAASPDPFRGNRGLQTSVARSLSRDSSSDGVGPCSGATSSRAHVLLYAPLLLGQAGRRGGPHSERQRTLTGPLTASACRTRRAIG